MQISSLTMKILAIATIGLAACGDDSNAGDDAPPVDSSPGVDAPTNELTCANYCSKITTNCTSTNMQPQFGMMSECMATCMLYPVGAMTDMAGHTLGCRLYHAGAAMVAPAVHCRHAGPGGDGVCGANCQSFCTLVLGSCTGANVQYGGDMNTCLTACGTFATTPPYTSDVRTGDSFACRLYHATAASANPGTHCKHTAAVSVGVCQ